MAITMAQAKALCNASELTLVKDSTRSEIGKLSAARLKQKVDRARKLRDKWRDQATSQRRATQSRKGARDVDGNARSAQKAELFGEVLDRFVARLEKVEATQKAGSVGARKNPPRSTRAVGHRATRAAVRKSMEETRQEMTAEAAKSRKKSGSTSKDGKPTGKVGAARKKPARPRSATSLPKDAESATSSAQTAPPATTQKTKASRKRVSGDGALDAARKTQGLSVTRKSQLQSRTAAKQNRLKTGGQTRTQKHLSAMNKRRQARRDSRS
ncbi:MAG: hypothetical protein KF861_04555 [Planctomycetaceae bacterium]|nr:hypothetical protein [Planctomycetaceae bacterium]